MFKAPIIKRAYTCFCLFFLFSGILNGQTKDYTFKSYSVQDGLSSSAVYDVMRADDGYVWFGTDVGISKFDGYRFKNFTQKDGITDNTVFKLIEDSSHRIWFLPFSGEIGYLENDKVCVYPHSAKLKAALSAKDWIVDIQFRNAGTIEFSSFRGTHGFIDINGEITLDKSIVTNLNSITIKKVDGDTRVNWTSKTDPLNKDEPWRTLSGSFKSNDAIILNDIDNKIDTIFNKEANGFNIFFNDTNGLAFAYGEAFYFIKEGKTIHQDYFLPPQLVKINKVGETWVTFRGQGVFVYKTINDFLENKEPEIKLFENINVSDVLHGEIEDAWVTTEHHGAFYIFNSRIVNHSFNSKKRNRITTVETGFSEELFYGNENGEVYRIDSLNNVKLMMIGSYGVNHIFCHDSNRILISITSPLKTEVFYDDSYDYQVQSRRNSMVTSKGVHWSTSYSDLIAEKDGVSLFNASKKVRYTFFYCSYEDMDGRVWFGAKTGLYTFENDDLKMRNDLFGNNAVPKIHDIAQLKDGTYLLGTQRGLYSANYKNGPQNFELLGLSSHDIKKIAVDKDEVIWVCTNKGLLRITHKHKKLIELYNIGGRIGLPSDEINDIAINGDEIFVATNEGLAQFSRQDIFKNEILPIVHVNSINVNEEIIERNQQEEYIFEYDQNYIQFDFVGLNYRSLGKVNYSYRLDGIDENWQFSQSRNVRYPLLNPGDYCFRLRAANEDNLWSTEKRISFKIKLPFWQKWWFLLLSGIFTLLVLIFISLNIRDSRNKKFIRTREIEIQKRKVIEAELKALRAQMNPHFTFNTLNSIQNSINNFDQKNALTYITNYSLLLRKVLENSRYLYITIAEEIEMLKLYLGLENLRFDNSIEYDFNIDKNIDANFYEIPSMIIQPMVENAIVHGLSGKRRGKKKLTISLSLEGEKIICIVEDTGIGRVKSAEIGKMKKLMRKSLGMQITKERLELFYKEKGNDLAFLITDLYNEKGEPSGTRVKIIFKTKKQPKL